MLGLKLTMLVKGATGTIPVMSPHWILWQSTEYRQQVQLKQGPYPQMTLLWRHNGGECVSSHQPHHGLLSRLFGRRSKETSKLRVTGLCGGIHRGPVNSPHKWPVARKMFPFDDVIIEPLFALRSTVNRIQEMSWNATVLIYHKKHSSTQKCMICY